MDQRFLPNQLFEGSDLTAWLYNDDLYAAFRPKNHSGRRIVVKYDPLFLSFIFTDEGQSTLSMLAQATGKTVNIARNSIQETIDKLSRIDV